MPKRSQWAARGSAGQTEGAHPLTIYTVGLAEFEKRRSIEKNINARFEITIMILHILNFDSAPAKRQTRPLSGPSRTAQLMPPGRTLMTRPLLSWR